MRKLLLVFTLFAFAAGQVQAFDLKDLARNIDRSYKCKSGDQSCKNRERLKAVARVAAIAGAVALITKMVIDYRSQRTSGADEVAAEYKAQNAQLPLEPVATEYTTKTLPGPVVEPGKPVVIQSDIVVVPGTKKQKTLIEERITIYDNEDNTKALNNLTKAVNAKTKTGGRYQNEFSFTLPEGLPQGVYPIKTQLLLDGKVVSDASNDIQLVMHVNERGAMQVVAMR
ncbi:hypothetical protein [Cellvibrio japonicus]|uniref:Uncharacterized protein n=1 Tax=Cellvibrio japonicus (strain Ueda107) TaxID=498211 RepID=B3PKU8_CELJU|nr:hypothetical protein [Cellvibrio japonicus]ACE85851.1 hypothetical protein CJA_0855 [Cellvibrio japonicus Ueda107]QEI11507.1 hypothetical protein FY117_04180 [Cellvibrio japonicus]QEI15081.1 hypothetical protein FY116_04180 [Cellvibrio japonicus]QEI18661.1 hypothetical protein FY115_04180 [Cellvibrio japonicus]